MSPANWAQSFPAPQPWVVTQVMQSPPVMPPVPPVPLETLLPVVTLAPVVVTGLPVVTPAPLSPPVPDVAGETEPVVAPGPDDESPPAPELLLVLPELHAAATETERPTPMTESDRTLVRQNFMARHGRVTNPRLASGMTSHD